MAQKKKVDNQPMMTGEEIGDIVRDLKFKRGFIFMCIENEDGTTTTSGIRRDDMTRAEVIGHLIVETEKQKLEAFHEQNFG